MQTRSSDNAKGIDVSHHNGTVNWQRVAASGYSFVFVKASEGTTYKDPTFETNVRGARQAGLLVGAYHFLNAKDRETAINEAANFAAAMSVVGGAASLDLPPVLDYETNPSGISQSELNAVAKAFLTEIERITARKPILYTGNDFAQNFNTPMGAYDLWVARYNTQPPWNVPAWSAWTFWQYSQKGSVPGISGAVDLNVFSGSLTELRAWTANQSGGKSEGKSGRKDVDDMATIEELQQVIQAQEARIAAMEKKLNMSGKEPLPSWAEPAVRAGKAAGAITTSADKSIPDLIALQMLKNLGLLDPDVLRALRSLANSQKS
ncbi:glycoside hydrolase family 25 protein [Paenibacillus physcomitrellae]|uniref:Lysozyme n=1 Tax=Paenibacillus physcomitrellae TaxID=1619311 RepID=A0ABQ1FTI1_9BACL|nr:glycoside hydrolase family 25 protein [Paenibacillus physcomitrellae]GGA27828.1 hypothetical protein GCM10010917_10950 [Paenibacillus physcomitrellae]